MALSLPTNLSTVEAWVGALYGYAVGTTTMGQINSDITSYGGLNNTLNAYYSASFGSATTASVAATIVANVGLGSDANAIAYVVGQLNAAPVGSRGSAVLTILNAFSALTADKTYGAAATAWNNTVSSSVKYAQSNASDATVANAAISANNLAFTLTTGVDNTPASSTTGILSTTTGVSTLTTLDTVTGLNTTGNTLTINDITGASPMPAGVTISNIQNLILTSAGTIGAASTLFDLSSYALGALTVASIGGTNASGIQASANTNVTENDSTVTTGNVLILGGKDVTDTVSGALAGTGTITIGSSTPALRPSGAIKVTATSNSSADVTIQAINTFGGTSQSITANLNTATASVGSYTTTAGTITANAGTTATSITVTQTPISTKFAAQTAVAGIPQATTAATSIAGQKYVAATQSVTTAIAAKAAVQGVVNGLVAIQDTGAGVANAAGQLTDVTINNFAASSTLKTNALKNLTISSLAGDLTLTDATPANTTLNVNANGTGSTAAQKADGSTANAIGTPTYVTLADGSSAITAMNVNLTGTNRLKITDTALTTLNLSGTGTLSSSTGLPLTLSNIALSGGASISATVSSMSALTSISMGNSSGTATLTLAGATQGFTGGTGVDTITLSADAAFPITGGSSTTDKLVFGAAPSTFAKASSTTSYTNITGFEIMGVNYGTADSTWDMTKFSPSFNTISVEQRL